MIERMHIALATASDLDRLCELAERVRHAPRWTRSLWQQVLANTAQHATLARVVAIARLGSEARGFVVATCVAGAAEIESIAVDEASQRQGIGRALWLWVKAWSIACGAETIALEVRASNVQARAFYASAGFVQVGLRPGYYADPAEDAVLLSFAIAPAGDAA